MRLLSMFVVAILTTGYTAVSVADNYGAIAYSAGTDSYGYAYDYSTQRDADYKALTECDTEDCEVILRYANACGAFATSTDAYGWGIAGSREAAEVLALDSCFDNSAEDDCGILVWSCTTR